MLIDGKAYLSGSWSLAELEVLCVVMRDALGEDARGIEEEFVTPKPTMPSSSR